VATFGKRLRELRQQAGLSQSDLAGEELSASYVSLLEADKRTPSHDVVQLLSARLGCSGSMLLDGQASDRDQRIELEMAYAKLAIEHGESLDARNRLHRLLAEDGVPLRVRDEATLLLGTAHERLSEYGQAVRVLHPLLDRAEAGLSTDLLIQVSMVLCRCYIDSGDVHRAADVGERALAAARAQGLGGTSEFFRLAATVMGAHIDLGDLLHARIWAESLIREAEDSGQAAGQAALYWNSAIVAELEGRLDEAVRLSERALARLSELDNLRDYAKVRLASAAILLLLEEPDVEHANRLLDGCLPDLRDLGSNFDLGEWNHAKSAVLLHQGDASGAEGRARQALDLLGDSSPCEPAIAWLRLQDALMAQGRSEEAAECRRQAAAKLDLAGNGRASALLWRDLAERMQDAGEAVEALDAYRKALSASGVRDRGQATRQAVSRFREQGRVSGPIVR